eukprot:s2801_g6.t1
MDRGSVSQIAAFSVVAPPLQQTFATGVPSVGQSAYPERPDDAEVSCQWLMELVAAKEPFCSGCRCRCLSPVQLGEASSCGVAGVLRESAPRCTSSTYATYHGLQHVLLMERPMRSANGEVLNPRNMMPEMPQTAAATQSMDLKKDREVSSIPKTGEAGNWVYPSPQQFYHALLRKNKEAEAEAMDDVVYAHNVTNERRLLGPTQKTRMAVETNVDSLLWRRRKRPMTCSLLPEVLSCRIAFTSSRQPGAKPQFNKRLLSSARSWCGIVVNENMNMIEEQLRRVDKTLDGSVDLAHKLIDMCMDFKAVVDDLPNTCNGMVPGAKEVMAMASDKANEKLTEMNRKVDAFARVAHSAKSAMVILLENFDVVKMLTIAGPMVPLILMGLWTLAIGIATIISWQSSNPHVAERADDAVIRFGTCGACCNTIVASMLASAYLFVGIAENPMISMIEDVERDAHALYSVYSNATWAVEPAKMVCNGVKNLNASDAMDACRESVNFAGQLIAASNVYPYYRTFAHDLMCDKMLHSMKLLILFTIVVSMILMPLVALCSLMKRKISILQWKWERYKMDNYEDHYDMSYEGHEGHEGHEKSQLLGVRKVEVTVEVRAVSGSCLGIMELPVTSTVADVKARLEGIAGRYDLASARGDQLIADSTELSELTEPGQQPIVLCLIRRRMGFVYTASNVDGSLTLWDLARREVVHRLQCSLCQPQCPICLFADWEQQRVLCCLEDGTLYLWGRTSETDESLHLLRVMQDLVIPGGWWDKEVMSLLESCEGKVLLGTMAGRLLLWDLLSGKILRDVVRVCWQRSEALSACRDRVIRSWKMETGECSLLRGHTSSVCCLLVNWDLRRAMSAGLMDGLRLWTLESRQSVEVSRLQMGEMGRIFCCDIDWKNEKVTWMQPSRDQEPAASGSLELAGGQQMFVEHWIGVCQIVWRNDSHGHDVYAVSFEPGSMRCLSAGEFSASRRSLGIETGHGGGPWWTFGTAVLGTASPWLLHGFLRLAELYKALVYLYDIPDKDTKPETGFKAKMICQLKDERKGAHQTVSLSCLAVEWPDAAGELTLPALGDQVARLSEKIEAHSDALAQVRKVKRPYPRPRGTLQDEMRILAECIASAEGAIFHLAPKLLKAAEAAQSRPEMFKAAESLQAAVGHGAACVLDAAHAVATF